MKNLLLSLFLFLGSLSTQAIPPLFGVHGVLSQWKCSWNNDLIVTSTGGYNCRFERSQTCTHWLWGTRVDGYSWEKGCNDQISPYDCPDGIEPFFIAQAMQEINNNGITVPSDYMNDSILANNSSILEACFNFRMTLAGYDVTNPNFYDSCYTPSVTLTVQVPLYGPIPVSLSCASISPNPVTDFLNISLNGLQNQLTSIQMKNNSTGSVVYENTNPNQSTIIIDVTGIATGLYNVILYRNDEYKSTLIQVNH